MAENLIPEPTSTEDVPFVDGSPFQSEAIHLARTAEGAGAYLGFSEEQVAGFDEKQRQAIHFLELGLAGNDELSDEEFAREFEATQDIAEMVAAGNEPLIRALAVLNMDLAREGIDKAYTAADPQTITDAKLEWQDREAAAQGMLYKE